MNIGADVSTGIQASLLWARFQQGDEVAFGEIYKTYLDTIYQYARRYTRDEQLIEDVIHDLFIYLWQHKAQLSQPLSIKFYLFSAIKRALLKEILKRKAESISLPDSLEREKLLPEYAVEDILFENQNGEDLKVVMDQALTTLSFNQRKAIELKFYHNLSCHEISVIMGLSPDNIYKLISRGIGVIKKNLKEGIAYKYALLFFWDLTEMKVDDFLRFFLF